MLQNTKKVFKIQLTRSATPPPFVQQVLLSRSCAEIGCLIEDICSYDFIFTYYTTYNGESLIEGVQIFEDPLCTIPVTSLDTGAPYKTQLQSQGSDSTAVGFNSSGVVNSVLGACF